MQYKFINDSDLNAQLREHHLVDLTDGDEQIVRKCERFALSIMHSKLNSRYNMSGLLVSPATEWNDLTNYQQGEYAFREIVEEGFQRDEIYIAERDNFNIPPETSTDDWELEDPRDELLIGICVNITIYRIFRGGISTLKIPEDVITDYNSAMEWLEDVRMMTENPDLPLKENGMDTMRYGGEAPRSWFQ